MKINRKFKLISLMLAVVMMLAIMPVWAVGDVAIGDDELQTSQLQPLPDDIAERFSGIQLLEAIYEDLAYEITESTDVENDIEDITSLMVRDGLWINSVGATPLYMNFQTGRIRWGRMEFEPIPGRQQFGALTLTRAQRTNIANRYLHLGYVQIDWEIQVEFTVEGNRPVRIEHGFNGVRYYTIHNPIQGRWRMTYMASSYGGGVDNIPRWGGAYWFFNPQGLLRDTAFHGIVNLLNN